MSNKNKPSTSSKKKGFLDSDADVNTDAKKDVKNDIGALLVEARKNLDLTIVDIADQLNLSKVIINQLENNQFSGSLPLAFVRGYVISYATKVGLDITTIKQMFDSQMGEESVTLKRVESLSIFEKNRKSFNSNNTTFKLISFLIIIVIVFFAGKSGWDKYKSLGISDAIQIKGDVGDLNLNEVLLDIKTAPVDIETDAENGAIDKNEGFKNSNVNTLPPTDKFASPSLVNSGLEETDSTELSVAKENITLKFSADCWVQIIDATGNELAFGIKKAGKVMNLVGVSPISVVLGDPSVVALDFNGKAIELSQYQEKRRAKIILK